MSDFIYYEEVHSNIDEIARFWGDKMPDMAIEELSELIQAISKVKRNKFGSWDNLIEEIADVYISLVGLCEHYSISGNMVMDAMNTKLRKTYDNPDKIAILIHNNMEDDHKATRISNALIRNKFTSEEKIRILITKENWWREVRGLGKESAKEVERIFGGWA